ncbi:FAD-dependent thymidylate synthase [Vulcanococcus sp.]|uniref:FAD-dependent thymidylate synthase n=1 Tax=Vulcanococcus sp. TaxID=2856995 RepID=UPI003BFB6E75
MKVHTLSRTERPQQVTWLAMHQDYCETSVWHTDPPAEDLAGLACVKHLLKGGRGHYGPLEHPSITLAVGGFPHCVMQQARTHRVGLSFDVQSLRYTGKRIVSVAHGNLDLEEVIYLRPVADYVDRQGKRYSYTAELRKQDLQECRRLAEGYAWKIAQGFSEEHSRSMLPFDFRQDFVVSFNLRSALHFMDLRSKADAQDEIRAMCDLLWRELEWWAPEICAWYGEARLGKAQLAP